MPPQQGPLTPIFRNKTDRKELSEFERGRIVSMHNKSRSKTYIQRYYSYLYISISRTIINEKKRDNNIFLPRNGSFKVYSNTEKRKILRHIRVNPKDIYTQVIETYKVSFKKSVVKKILKKYNI